MQAITTFPAHAWDIYARECVESLVKRWPGPVRIYFEGNAPPPLEGAVARPLNFPKYHRFMDRPEPSIETRQNKFLWQAKRFCHKVFCQIDAASEGEPFWWVDADVFAKDDVPAELLQQDDMVTFLGRNTYTETGLVGFNPKHPDFRDFIRLYESLYTEGEIYELPYWTDCHAFDYARQGKGKNLTPHGRGFDNVLKDTELGKYLVHLKGNRKFTLFHGGAHALSANI